MSNNWVKQLATNEEGFCFDPHTGDTYQLNPVSYTIIQALKENGSEEQIAYKLEQEYDVTFSEAFSDVQEFIQVLRIHGLIRP